MQNIFAYINAHSVKISSKSESWRLENKFFIWDGIPRHATSIWILLFSLHRYSKIEGLARPLNVIESSYNFAGFISVSKRNIKSVGQSYLRTFIFFRHTSSKAARYNLENKHKPPDVFCLDLQASVTLVEQSVQSTMTLYQTIIGNQSTAMADRFLVGLPWTLVAPPQMDWSEFRSILPSTVCLCQAVAPACQTRIASTVPHRRLQTL